MYGEESFQQPGEDSPFSYLFAGDTMFSAGGWCFFLKQTLNVLKIWVWKRRQVVLHSNLAQVRCLLKNVLLILIDELIHNSNDKKSCGVCRSTTKNNAGDWYCTYHSKTSLSFSGHLSQGLATYTQYKSYTNFSQVYSQPPSLSPPSTSISRLRGWVGGTYCTVRNSLYTHIRRNLVTRFC